MPVVEVVVLLPCHSLEDFPLHHEGDAAEGLLAACTAIWHPALIAGTRKLPTWCRADSPPYDLAGRLFVLPEASESWLPSDFADQVEAAGAKLIRGARERNAFVALALESLPDQHVFTPEVVADFYALGFCRWHVELLTRVMRYTSTIDEQRLAEHVLAAVDAAIAGDGTAFREAMTQAFELLNDSRKYFFPVDAYLLDLTLVAETTIGPALRQTVAANVPVNLLICGKVLETMAAKEPDSLAAVRAGLDRQTLGLAGGEYEEREFPLLPEETWRADLLKGIATYEQLLGTRPTVYGRRRAGLSPLLPQLLCRTGFLAALHFTLDDGRFPTAYQSKVRWDSPDGSVIEALAQVPLDARRPEPFLELPRKLGEAMDREQVATLIFAHWPGLTSMWYEELRRVAGWTTALGKFVTLEDYFAHTATSGSFAGFRADDYQYPYLEQGVSGGTESISSHGQTTDLAVIEQDSIDALASIVMNSANARTDDLGKYISADGSAHRQGVLIFNGSSLPARISAKFNTPLAPGGPVLASDSATHWASVDAPQTGFVWASTSESTWRHGQQYLQESDPGRIRNEFFEVLISPETGGIQAVHEFGVRGNRLTQQLALRTNVPQEVGTRWRDPDQSATYTRMVAESIERTQANAATNEVTSRGTLVDEAGEVVAKFTQKSVVAAGVRLIYVILEVELLKEIAGDPWTNYLANRIALADRNWIVRRNVGLGAVETEHRRILASQYLDIQDGAHRLAILPWDLPFHRQTSERMFDTLLCVAGESKRYWAIHLGIGMENPSLTELSRLDILVPRSPDQNQSGWFFHLDARNVTATAWEWIDGGFRVRLRELFGAAGSLALQSFRPIASARQTDFLGNTLCEPRVEGDKIWLEMAAHEWIQVEAEFR